MTTRYSGATVVGGNGKVIGQVRDVIFEGGEETNPSWLVVKTGRIRGEHYVPAGDLRHEAERLVVPFSAEQVKAAPRAGRDHILTRQLQQDLAHHYQLAG